MLALVLGLIVLGGGALLIDAVAQRRPGEDAALVAERLAPFQPGVSVVMGNSVARSAVEIDDLRAYTWPEFANLILPGSGPTTWYTLFAHRLAAGEVAPRLLVLVTSVPWLAHTRPALDRTMALELSGWDDPLLAELIETDPDGLAWERRLAARQRARDALVNLLAEPLGGAVARYVRLEVPPGADPLDTAVNRTFGQVGGASAPGPLFGPQRLPDADERETRGGLDPSFSAVLRAAEAAGTRVIVVLLPSPVARAGDLSSEELRRALSPGAQLLDMTTVPFEAADFADIQHFSPSMHAALSHTIAVYVSQLWMSPSERVIRVRERPAIR